MIASADAPAPVPPVPPVLRRLVALTPIVLAVIGALAVLALLSGTGRATVTQHGPEDHAAAAAVAALAGPHPERAVLPPDLGRVTGDAVGRVAGRPVSADGGCSSPLPLPAAFSDACRAHDLGYDVLRVAAAHDAALGSWARRAVDERLARDLAVACDTGVAGSGGDGCHLAADLADLVVRANSWRQGDGVPVAEEPATVVAGAVATAGALVIGVAR